MTQISESDFEEADQVKVLRSYRIWGFHVLFPFLTGTEVMVMEEINKAHKHPGKEGEVRRSIQTSAQSCVMNTNPIINFTFTLFTLHKANGSPDVHETVVRLKDVGATVIIKVMSGLVFGSFGLDIVIPFPGPCFPSVLCFTQTWTSHESSAHSAIKAVLNQQARSSLSYMEPWHHACRGNPVWSAWICCLMSGLVRTVLLRLWTRQHSGYTGHAHEFSTQ